MDLNEEIWNILNSRSKITTEEQKRAVHVEILRAIEKSKTNVGKRLGVTVMTESASLAGNVSAQNRNKSGNPGQSRPKSL